MDHRGWNGAQVVAFATAFVFGVVAALGIVLERVDLGGTEHTWWISAAVMASIVLMIIAAEVCGRLPAGGGQPAPSGWLGPQALGALLPVLAAHGFLAIARAGSTTLVEDPAQLVNDLVLVFGLFGLVQVAVARRRGERLFWIVASTLVVAAYVRTAEHWHRDAFEGLAVLRYVVGQVTAGAIGIFLLVALRSAGGAGGAR